MLADAYRTAHPDVLVVVGTQTGNSELVADSLAAALGEVGFSVHVVDAADATPEVFSEYRQLVFVTCTWANGTFPDNAIELIEALETITPDLRGLAFSLVGLGDRDYAPYYQTALYRLDELLLQLGARRVLPALEIDGVPAPRHFEETAEWALDLGAAFGDTAG